MAQLKDLLVLGEARIIGNLYGALKGNADTASSAAKLTTARTISLGGNLSGSTSFDGSGNVTISGQVNSVRDSHNGKAITITYGKAGQASTSQLGSWNGYELGTISPANITAGAASKLTANGGSATQPVYFTNGVPTACTYTLGKSVPSNAVFTDTNNKVTQTAVTASDYTNWRPIVWGASNGAKGFSPTTVTDGTFTTNTLSVQPSSGTIRATIFEGALSGNASTASSATKLSSSAGSATQPVYFSDGKPVACTYTLNKSVPANAVFTDTVYTLPAAGTTLGGVKTTSTVTSASGYTACPIISGVPYYKDTNTTYSLSSFGLTASATELNYVKGVTSAIQTQLNGKVPSGRKVNNKALSADITLTASDVGAAASSHTHNYAGSSSAGGVANSAAKLSTARTVSGGTDITMSYSYDGSANSTVNIGFYSAVAISSNKANYPWHRFAKLNTITGSWVDQSTIFLICDAYKSSNFGIFKVDFRTDNAGAGAVATINYNWLVRSGFSLDSVKVGLYNVAANSYADIFVQGSIYAGIQIRTLANGKRSTIGRSWILVSSNEASDTTSSDKKTSTEVYATIEAAATQLHGQAYTNIISGTDTGIVNYANSAGSVAWNNVSGKPSTYAPSSHTHSYAGSSSAGGSASSAVKLDTATAGSATQPVYFTGGKPTACTYTLSKSVPSNAVFTDTVYTLPTASSSTLGGVKTTSTVTSNSGYTACPIIGGVPYYKDTNTTYSLSSFGLTASATELNYTKGVTSAIQTQLNGKVPTSRTINGKALSANITLAASDVGAAASGHTHNKTATATLSASSWSNKAQSVTVSGVTTSNTIIVSAAPASHVSYCESGIYCSAQAANSLTFTCDTVPTANITVNVVILGG